MDAVQVMTLHRAKGMEFDHVLLAELEKGVWPNWQAEQHGAIAEERRLFYSRRDPGPALAAAELGPASPRLGRQAVALPGRDPEEPDRERGGTAVGQTSHSGRNPGRTQPIGQAAVPS